MLAISYRIWSDAFGRAFGAGGSWGPGLLAFLRRFSRFAPYAPQSRPGGPHDRSALDDHPGRSVPRRPRGRDRPDRRGAVVPEAGNDLRLFVDIGRSERAGVLVHDRHGRHRRTRAAAGPSAAATGRRRRAERRGAVV